MFDEMYRTSLMSPLSNNGTFKVMINMVDHQFLASTMSKDKNWVWHQIFGHLNFRSLTLMCRKKMAYGFPWTEVLKHLCEECCIAKQTRKPF